MELKTYNQVFEKLVDNIEKVAFPSLVSKRAHPNAPAEISNPETVSWIQKILRYNVPRYSQFR